MWESSSADSSKFRFDTRYVPYNTFIPTPEACFRRSTV